MADTTPAEATKAASPKAEASTSPKAEAAAAAASPKAASPKAASPTPITSDNPAEAETAIEADTRPDTDSVLGDDELSTFTASLTSSVVDYPVEHGRRYHAFRSGVYPMPNDEPELDRLDLMHVLMVKGIGEKLFLAPLVQEKTQRILDIGTGTGIWAMCMGDEFPQAEVLANDLSAVQPTWVPPNVKFEVDDVESPWLHTQPFDFIFSRYMAACLADWPKFVGNVFANLNPGGWAEFQDFDLTYYSEDGTYPETSSTHKWINTLLDVSKNIGRDPCPGSSLEKWAKEAGFVNVQHRRFKFPIGPWAKDPKMKEIGMYNIAQALRGLEGFTLRLFCDVLKWREEEVLVMTSAVRKELKSLAMHIQFDLHVVYGQKPEENKE